MDILSALEKAAQKDICCVGHISRDRVITPKIDVQMPGGSAYYVAKAISKLPPKVSFKLVTKMAEKDREVALQMQRDGIDVRICDSKDTVYFENIYGDNPDERKQRVLAKSDPFTYDDIGGIPARYYMLGALLPDDFSLKFIEYIWASGGYVVLDAQGFLRRVRYKKVCGRYWHDYREMLHSVRILKVNEDEAYQITSSIDMREAAEMIETYGVNEAVVTLGSKGSLIYAYGKCYEVPAFKPTKLVDATGCGDTYMAGYVYMRAQDVSPYESGLFAAAMCTLKLGHSGPFDASIDDVTKLLKKEGYLD